MKARQSHSNTLKIMITVYDEIVALEYARSNQMWLFTSLTQPELANSNPDGLLVHSFVEGHTRRECINIPNNLGAFREKYTTREESCLSNLHAVVTTLTESPARLINL